MIDLAKATRERWPEKFVFAGGHSASFVAREILEHAAGTIDCVVKGEGEGLAPRLLEAARDDGRSLDKLPGTFAQWRMHQDSLFIHPRELMKPLRATAGQD